MDVENITSNSVDYLGRHRKPGSYEESADAAIEPTQGHLQPNIFSEDVKIFCYAELINTCFSSSIEDKNLMRNKSAEEGRRDAFIRGKAIPLLST